jgi:hypothetical protein
MKKKLIILLITFLPFWLSAQCYDCYSKKPEIAVGVTLYSNMKFTPQGQTTQPLELNLRYKISENSTLRIGTPIVWKQNISGEPVAYSFTPSLEEYVENMHDEDLYPLYNSFYRILDNYYNLYGVSLGYDYNIPVTNNLSALIGCDLGYFNQKITSNYYRLNNGSIDENQQYKYFYLQKTEQINKHNILSIKPLLGLRFSFQKLTFEADLAYHVAYDLLEIKGINRFWYAEVNSFEDQNNYYRSQNFFTNSDTPNRIVYSFRLFYNL